MKMTRRNFLSASAFTLLACGLAPAAHAEETNSLLTGLLGNLLENAVFASQKLPPDERQVRVMARMLSPAMLGIVVENRYDGVLKKQKGVLHSTKHEGQGIGLVSIHTTVQKYHGNLTVETENNVFRANVLLNL